MIVCIDVTEMINVNFISGIQRVVKEVTIRWIEKGYPVKMMVYDFPNKYYRVLNNQEFHRYYTRGGDKKFSTEEIIQIEDFNEQYLFFDMDSVWMNALKRSYLLPLLKSKGVYIAAHIYDIIPVTEAQYCHEFTTLSFLEYIGAQIKYADLIIANAQATIHAIQGLIKGTEVKQINSSVVALGSDIRKGAAAGKLRDSVVKAVKDKKYVLMVGTIEPRKNHRFVLEAFDKQLFSDDICLVFAGRIGWNMEDFLDDVRRHKEFNRRFFMFNDASDREITYLYEHSFLVAFASYNEGFGLPIIEAFERNTLVLAADIPVLHEVGGELCKYFSLDNIDEFVSQVRGYIKDPDIYKKDKEKIGNYQKRTWDECATDMWNVLYNRGRECAL